MVKKKPPTKTSETKAQPKSFRNLLTFRLHMVARLSERVSEEYYRRQFDLSLPECRVIGITGGYGSVSFKKVASDTYLEKSYASRVVSSLVERGIIEKQENPSDSRSVLLCLTEEGLRVHDEMHQAAIRFNDWLTASMAVDQPQKFTEALIHIERRLETIGQSFDSYDSVTEALTDARKVDNHAPGDSIQLDRQLAEALAAALATQLNS